MTLQCRVAVSASDRSLSRTCSPNRKRGRSRSRSPIGCSKPSAAQPAPGIHPQQLPLQHPLQPPLLSQGRQQQKGSQADLGRVLLPVCSIKEEPGLTAVPAPVSPASGIPASFTATQLQRRQQRMSLFSDTPPPVHSDPTHAAEVLRASCDAHDHAGTLARHDTCEAVQQVSGGAHSPAQGHGVDAAATAAAAAPEATVANSRQLPASLTEELASPQLQRLAELQAQPQAQLGVQQPGYIAVRLTHDNSS